MLNRKRLLVSAALIFISLLGASAAKADTPACYSLSSLQGTYSIVTTYGSHVAMALSTRTLDDSGNLTGTFLINEPTPLSTTGARTLVTGTQVGTVTVNCDGAGVITRVLTVTGGGTVNAVDDFLVTSATGRAGKLFVTSLVDMQRTPSAIVPGGVFVSRVWTRLPDWNDISHAVWGF
jgi:hypothetical protein